MKSSVLYTTTVCIILFISFGSSSYASTITNKKRLAFVDTTGREKWLYKTFIDIIETVGFRPTYISLDSLIDNSLSKLSFSRYDAVFFVFGSDFIEGLTHKNYLTEKILKIIAAVSKKPNKLIGLIMPPLRANPRFNLLLPLIPLWKSMNINVPRFPFAPSFPVPQKNVQQQSLDAFFYAANRMLVPLEARPISYHTTLRTPSSGVQLAPVDFEKTLGALGPKIFYLPMNHSTITHGLDALLPFGLYWFNEEKKNHLFITNLSLLACAGISENFHLCPVDFKIRQDLLSLIEQMMWELFLLSSAKQQKSTSELKEIVLKSITPPLPKTFNDFGKPYAQSETKDHYRKIAWLEIGLFAKDDKKPKEEQVHAQDFLIDTIVNSGLDSLWITFNPQMYYSAIGRLSKPDQEKTFLDSVSLFTKKLKTTCEQKNKKIPALLVGFEITNNVYKPNLPVRYAVDIFGNLYPDLPTPLDNTFWHNEVIKPLEIFVHKWKNPTISHGIPLSGIVLDLEMYCRQKSGIFTATMGFDGYTFDLFSKYMHRTPKAVSLQDRVLELMNKKAGKIYFDFLEKRAKIQGRELFNECNRLIKNCYIMCYMPSILITWFYKGLCQGLTSSQKPVHLLTFNNEFGAHTEWFKKNNIPAYHGTVLLLSKIKTQEDFSWVSNILLRGDIWFNRWSRWGEKAKMSNDWTSVEAPTPAMLEDSVLRDEFFQSVQNSF